MFKVSRLWSCWLALLLGCSGHPPAEEPVHDSVPVALDSIEAAEAAAITAALDKTMYTSKLNEQYDCIFFENVTAGALARIRSRLGTDLPRLSTHLEYLDRRTFTDKRTNDPALFVKVVRHSVEADRIVFGVRILTHERAGFFCRVEMERSKEGPKVINLSLIIGY